MPSGSWGGRRPSLAAYVTLTGPRGRDRLRTSLPILYLGKIVESTASDALCARPMHPYTQALFAAALPSHPDDPRPDRTIAAEGSSSLASPSGCRFQPGLPRGHSRLLRGGAGIADQRRRLPGRLAPVLGRPHRGERRTPAARGGTRPARCASEKTPDVNDRKRSPSFALRSRMRAAGPLRARGIPGPGSRG